MISTIVIAQLLSLFELHGAVPGFEFTAEGFDVKDLLDRGLIRRPFTHLDSGYVMGPELERQIPPLHTLLFSRET